MTTPTTAGPDDVATEKPATSATDVAPTATGSPAPADPSPASDPMPTSDVTPTPEPTPTPAPVKRSLEGVIRLVAADPVEAGPSAQGTRSRPSHVHGQVLIVGDRSYALTGRTGRPNRKVRVSGAVSGSTVEAETIQDLGAVPAGLPSTGTTRMLVMLAQWTAPDSVTPDSARAQMFGDTNNWYRDASYNALGLSGDVTPWMRIAGPANGRCFADREAIMQQAKDAAAAQGFNLASYANFALYFPNNGGQAGSDCNNYAGWAYVGAANSWLNGYLDRRVTVHELGHNYGLYHAHSYLCTDGASGTCGWSDYGDDFDSMGASIIVGHFSASQKNILGWMAGRTVDLSAGGSATLAPLAADPVAVGAAVVRVTPNRSYWLEYRKPIDFDSAQPSAATDGVQVRLIDPNLPDVVPGDTGANLIDVRPADGLSVNTATLRPGESWTSPEGYRFATTSATTAGAAVTVTSGGPTCPDAALEPDNTAATAKSAAVPSTKRHAFCTPNDQDWISFAGVAGRSYRIETLNLTPGTDTVLELYRGSTLLQSNDDTNGLASLIDYRADATATYHVKARQYTGANDPNYTYDLKLTQLATDTSAPTVRTKSPTANSTSVNVTLNVTATFSEAVVGVTGSTFRLKNAAGTAVAAAVSYNATTNVATLDPTQNLAADTRYTVTLTGGAAAIRDAAGNPLAATQWTFLTGPAPTVTARTPASGATAVSRTADITATFSETVSGVTGTTFVLKNAGTGAVVAAVVSRSGTTNRWILNPNATLAAQTRYTAVVTGGSSAIKDTAGNPLPSTSWSFTTGS
jgi:M6 family metalloprotease-like protein